VDLATDKNSIALIADFYSNNKPVAFVSFNWSTENVKVNGEFLVKGKKLTGFSNAEEAAVGLTDVVPFFIRRFYKKMELHILQ
jgi:putative intracellular protease/amidase